MIAHVRSRIIIYETPSLLNIFICILRTVLRALTYPWFPRVVTRTCQTREFGVDQVAEFELVVLRKKVH